MIDVTHRLRLPCLLALLVLTVTGCSDSGDDPAGTMDPPAPTVVSFADEVQPIFDAACAGCHGSPGNAELTLLAGQSWADLVGVTATESTMPRVTPGDPASSWLYLKMTDAQTVGSPMPPTGVLPEAARETVRQWIEEGALDN